MHKLQTWLNGQRELSKLSPRLQTLSILQAICNVGRQILLVMFLSKTVQILSSKDKNQIYILVLLFALQIILFFLESFLSSVCDSKTNLLLYNEQKSVTELIMKIPYAVFSGKDFQEKIAAHKNALSHNGSAFQAMVEFTATLIRSVLGLALSFWLLLPFFKTLFQNTGDSWLESSWFGVSLLGLIAVGAAFIVIISAMSNRKFFKLRKRYVLANRLFRYYADMLIKPKNTKEIRLYNAEKLIFKQATDDIVGRGLETQKQIANVQAISGIAYAIIAAVLAGCAYFFLGSKGLSGALTADEVVLSIGALLQLIQAVSLLAEIAGRLKLIVSNLSYYFDIINTPIPDNSGKAIPKNNQPTIEFCNVSYRYPGADNYALKNISITILPSETLAIVGENGSGKTTFVKLLCRLLKPTKGEILLDGINIWDISADEYNKLFSAVFQDFSLFALPVLDNIVCDVDYSEREIYDLLKAVNLSKAIAERDNAATLSGGEVQRAAIARALYRDSEILLLDEPTASLDPVTERDIYTHFAELAYGKTAIYISHRLASCRFCQRVAVFEHGRLTQLGSHDELVRNGNGKYAQLWKVQADFYRER